MPGGATIHPGPPEPSRKAAGAGTQRCGGPCSKRGQPGLPAGGGRPFPGHRRAALPLALSVGRKWPGQLWPQPRNGCSRWFSNTSSITCLPKKIIIGICVCGRACRAGAAPPERGSGRRTPNCSRAARRSSRAVGAPLDSPPCWPARAAGGRAWRGGSRAGRPWGCSAGRSEAQRRSVGWQTKEARQARKAGITPHPLRAAGTFAPPPLRHLSIWSGQGLPGSAPGARGEEGWPDGESTLRGRRLPRKKEATEEAAGHGGRMQIGARSSTDRGREEDKPVGLAREPFAGSSACRAGQAGAALTRQLGRPRLLLLCQCACRLAV